MLPSSRNTFLRTKLFNSIMNYPTQATYKELDVYLAHSFRSLKFSTLGGMVRATTWLHHLMIWISTADVWQEQVMSLEMPSFVNSPLLRIQRRVELPYASSVLRSHVIKVPLSLKVTVFGTSPWIHKHLRKHRPHLNHTTQIHQEGMFSQLFGHPMAQSK